MKSSRNHWSRCRCSHDDQLPVSCCKAQTQSLVALFWHPGGILGSEFCCSLHIFLFLGLVPSKTPELALRQHSVCQIVRAYRLAPAGAWHHVTFKSVFNRLSPFCFRSLTLNLSGSAPLCYMVHNRVVAATQAGNRVDAPDQVAAEHVPVPKNISVVNVEQRGGA